MKPRIGLYIYFKPASGGGERYLLTAAEALCPLGDVEVLCPHAFDLPALARSFALDLDGARMVPHPWRRFHGARDWLARGRYDLFLALDNHLAPLQLSLGRRGILHLQAPPYAPPFHTPLRSKVKLRTYDRVVVNSRFTETWARRHGTAGLPIDVVYPPIDVESFRPGEKRARIVSIGRFFVGRHEKKHRALLDAFRALRAAGAEGWELHFAGALREQNAGDVAYLEALRAESRDLPVHFHVNAPFTEIRDLYAGATVYWHAAGFGVDAEADPQHLEHFGMAIAEAMAAGAIPFVFPAGGPLEIVEDEQTGFFWRTPEELGRRTRALLARPEAERREIAAQASAAVQRFSKARFAAEIRTLAESLLSR
ncbi:MAG: glycosyltransferase [Candidatus Binatia bacterium]